MWDVPLGRWRLVGVGLVATFCWASPPALAQQGGDALPPLDQNGGVPAARSAESAPRSARTPTREQERAAALARGRQRFFSQVDEFGTDKGPPLPGPGVFPIGPNGMPTVNSVPKLRRH